MANNCTNLFNCCDCGGVDCGCPGCWSCNHCESCGEFEDWDFTEENPDCEFTNWNE